MSSHWPSEAPTRSPSSDAGPTLNFDLEEGAFRLLRAWWHRMRPPPQEENRDSAEVRLEDHVDALRVVAQLIAHAPVKIKAAKGVGGVRGMDLLLPARVAIAPDAEANRNILMIRTAISAAIFRVESEEPTLSNNLPRPIESLRMARAAIDWLEDDLPGFAHAHEESVQFTLDARPALEALTGQERLLESIRRSALRGEQPWLDAELCKGFSGAPARGRKDAASPDILLWGEIISDSNLAAGIDDPDSSVNQESELPPAQDSTEVEAPAIDEIERITLDEKESEDAVLIHTFEKVETADEYRGGSRDTDGADELADQLEALEEVDLR